MRVIAGVSRGRPLQAPKNEQTRPTADLIKGVVFSMLDAEAYKRGYEPDEDGRFAAAQAWPRVLDLFAGSGALGIEALSRGAEWAEFVDQSAESSSVILANLRTLGFVDSAVVHKRPVEAMLPLLRGPFDAIFLDPPYVERKLLERALQSLVRLELLRPSSVVVVEQAESSEAVPEQAGLVLARSRRHGRTRVTLFTPAARE